MKQYNIFHLSYSYNIGIILLIKTVNDHLKGKLTMTLFFNYFRMFIWWVIRCSFTKMVVNSYPVCDLHLLIKYLETRVFM